MKLGQVPWDASHAKLSDDISFVMIPKTSWADLRRGWGGGGGVENQSCSEFDETSNAVGPRSQFENFLKKLKFPSLSTLWDIVVFSSICSSLGLLTIKSQKWTCDHHQSMRLTVSFQMI